MKTTGFAQPMQVDICFLVFMQSLKLVSRSNIEILADTTCWSHHQFCIFALQYPCAVSWKLEKNIL